MILNLPDETLTENKYIYGTYVEMAFHNIFVTMKYIYFIVMKKNIEESILKLTEGAYTAKYLNTECLSSQEQGVALRDFNKLKESFNDEQNTTDFSNQTYWKVLFKDLCVKEENKAKALELFRKHFPILTPIGDNEEGRQKPKCAHGKNNAKQRCKEVLASDMSFEWMANIVEFIRVIRNEYSHYAFVANKTQVECYNKNEYRFINCMKRAFDGSKRIVKERFSYAENEIQCADRFYCEKVIGDSGKRMIKTIEKEKYIYKIDYVLDEGEKKVHHFTPYGLTFFICQFLEKKYIKLFTDKLRYVLPQDKKIILEMMSVYRIKLPQNKITSSDTTFALGLDMLNEMRRCPKELFEVISPNDQQKFRVPVSECDDDEVLMLRHSDRFAYFAMRYIDEKKLLPSIRFQVSLGRYFFKFYNKKCIDSDTADRVRSLHKDLNGFGRINAIEDERNSVWADLIRRFEDVHANTEDEEPYITDHHAKYVFNNNRIGMLILPKKDTHECVLPKLNGDGASNIAPTCWMSIYELPAMLFLILLKGHGGKVQDVIKKHVDSCTKLFNDIASGDLTPFRDAAVAEAVVAEQYKLDLKKLPQKIQDYLTSRDVDVDTMYMGWAKERIEYLLEETKYKLGKFEKDIKLIGDSKNNKIGKKRFVEIEDGKLADFLAHDMMFFLPVNESNSNKLTGLNFRILQANLATSCFEDNSSLSRLLVNSKLVGNQDRNLDHPFLYFVLRNNQDISNVKALYIAYLKERAAYLKVVKQNQDNYRNLYFLHPNRTYWKVRDENFYKKLAKRYLKDEFNGKEFAKSIELPRGLFTLEIRKALLSLENPELTSIANDLNNNTSYLINAYFKHVINDDCQEMYYYDRSYALFNSLWRKNGFNAPEVFKTVDEIYNFNTCARECIDNKISSISLSFNDKKKHVHIEDKQNEEREKLENQLRRMKHSEKIIRRYKIQDMLTFLMAKDILLDNTKSVVKKGTFNAIDALMLHSIIEGKALNQHIHFSVDFEYDNTTKASKTIYQDDFPLKNYTTFYQIIYDRRLPSLLKLTKEDRIERSTLEKEFEKYDLVHPEILKKVFEVEKELNVDYESKGSYKPFRNAPFKNEDTKNILVAIRNSFAHYTYPSKVAAANEAELPKKAESIKTEFYEKVAFNINNSFEEGN